MFFLRKHTTARLNPIPLFARPLLCAVVTCGATWGVHSLLSMVLPSGGRMISLILLLASGITAVAVYVVTMLAFKSITADEVRLLPFGGKIASFLIRKGLLHETH